MGFILLTLSYLPYLWLDDSVGATYLVLYWTAQNVLWFSVYIKGRLPHKTVLVLGLLSVFFCARQAPPLLEDDHFRYFWDGHQVILNGNPYHLPPSKASHPKFSHIKDKVNYPDLVTLYPPIAQYTFALLAQVSQNQLSVFLWLLAFCGSSFALASFAWLNSRNNPNFQIRNFFLFATHPLIVKEWYNSCHYDPLLVSFLLLGAGCRSHLLAAVYFSLGAQVKLTTLVAYLRFKWNRTLFLSLAILFVLSTVVWLPFLRGFENFLSTLKTFGSHWEFNSGLFRLFRELGYLIWEPSTAHQTARSFVAILWFCVSFGIWRVRNLDQLEKLFWTLFLLVLMSPVANTWYFSWSLPLAFFLPKVRKQRVLIAYTFLPMAYLFYLPQGAVISFQALWTIEHLCIWGCVLLCLPFRRFISYDRMESACRETPCRV